MGRDFRGALDTYSAAVDELMKLDHVSESCMTMLSIARCGLGASLLSCGQESLAVEPLRKAVADLHRTLNLAPQADSSLHSHLLMGLRSLLMALESVGSADAQAEGLEVCRSGLALLRASEPTSSTQSQLDLRWIAREDRLLALSRFHFGRARLLQALRGSYYQEEVLADLSAAEEALITAGEVEGAFRVTYEVAMVLTKALSLSCGPRDDLAFSEMPFPELELNQAADYPAGCTVSRERVALAWRKVFDRGLGLATTAAPGGNSAVLERWVEEMVWARVMEAGVHDELSECLPPLNGATDVVSSYVSGKDGVSRRLATLCGDIYTQLCLAYVRLGNQVERGVEDGRRALYWYDIASGSQTQTTAEQEGGGAGSAADSVLSRQARVWGLLALAAVQSGDLGLSNEAMAALRSLEREGFPGIRGPLSYTFPLSHG